jgi:putative membrane protein
MTDKDKVRDHLANERTFLAWVRTSLGLIGLGFVLARMGLFLRQIDAAVSPGSGSARVLHAGQEFLVTGVVFLSIGTAFGALSGWLYARNRRAIDSERFEPEAWPVAALTAVVVGGGLVVIGLVAWRVMAAGAA